MDERIHFALVCGAKSCPPIRIYTPESLEEGLQGAAEAFCTSEVVVDPMARSVSLSKIFQVRRSVCLSMCLPGYLPVCHCSVVLS